MGKQKVWPWNLIFLQRKYRKENNTVIGHLKAKLSSMHFRGLLSHTLSSRSSTLPISKSLTLSNKVDFLTSLLHG